MSQAPPPKPPAPAHILESAEIQRILPHRYPMLLIDRVVAIEPRQRIVAIKNVSADEPFFSGHFPGFPIMPGVLIVEAMAQAGGALVMQEATGGEGMLMVFTGIERARFRKPVLPGDQLRLEVSVLAWRQTAVRMQGSAYVGEKLAAEAVITCQLVDRARMQGKPAAAAPERP